MRDKAKQLANLKIGLRRHAKRQGISVNELWAWVHEIQATAKMDCVGLLGAAL